MTFSSIVRGCPGKPRPAGRDLFVWLNEGALSAIEAIGLSAAPAAQKGHFHLTRVRTISLAT